MAFIQLSCVDSDQAEAQKLQTALEGSGHEVVGPDFNRPSLQETDIVLVIWSPGALVSPYVYEQARVALSSHCLVQVIATTLDVNQLPAVFRTRTLTPIADAAAVLGEIETVLGGPNSAALASFKTPNDHGTEPDNPDTHTTVTMPLQVAPSRSSISARSPQTPKKEVAGTPDELSLELEDIFGQSAALAQSASIPPAPMKIPPYLAKAALEQEARKLNHKIPSKMRVGATEVIEVRFDSARQGAAMMGSGGQAAEELLTVETLTVDLYGSPDIFRITRRSRPSQLVKGSLIRRAPLNEQRFGRWLWHVTPKKSGRQELVVKVSADLSDNRGVATSEPYEDRTFSVKVRASVGLRALKWTAAASAISALAGACTQEFWWPRLKALLFGTGFLG